MNDPRKASLDSLLTQVPHAVPPERELWPQIAAQLGAQQADARRTAAERSRWLAGWPRAIAAGLLIAALSVLLTVGLMRQRAEQLAGSTHAPLTSVSFELPQDAAYQRTRQALEQTFRQRLQLLAPATRTRIEADLQTIQKANADIRDALARDPASPVLQHLLESTWQQEIDLYRDVARSTEPMI
ncbi:MAG: hypothetical protein QM718_07530 [Steroidobacteraceae bacterium]